MDSAYLSALSALLGSVIGGFTSLAASWVSQNSQARIQQRIESRNQRRQLYTTFIDTASKLYGEALFSNKVEIPNMVGLYTIISQMRVVSSPAVIEAGEKVARLVIDTYFAPNKTLEQIHAEFDQNHQPADVLKEFSLACRQDLEQMQLR